VSGRSAKSKSTLTSSYYTSRPSPPPSPSYNNESFTARIERLKGERLSKAVSASLAFKEEMEKTVASGSSASRWTPPPALSYKAESFADSMKRQKQEALSRDQARSAAKAPPEMVASNSSTSLDNVQRSGPHPNESWNDMVRVLQSASSKRAAFPPHSLGVSMSRRPSPKFTRVREHIVVERRGKPASSKRSYLGKSFGDYTSNAVSTSSKS
jgi:hypothetical protein